MTVDLRIERFSKSGKAQTASYLTSFTLNSISSRSSKKAQSREFVSKRELEYRAMFELRTFQNTSKPAR